MKKERESRERAREARVARKEAWRGRSEAEWCVEYGGWTAYAPPASAAAVGA